MSAYVVSDNTINVLAKAFVDYEVKFKAEGFEMPSMGGIVFNTGSMKQAIGEHLLKKNYDAVNFRYHESETPRDYNYENLEINEGTVLGCIRCYEYQACELDDYFESELHGSMLRLKDAIAERLVKKLGFEIPWGYEEE